MNGHSDDFSTTDDMRDLSQAYRDAVKHGDDREPSPALDAAILAAAHRAVESRPRDASPFRQPPRFFARWRLPLAMAASLLICVSVVLLFEPKKTALETPVVAQAPRMQQAMPEPARKPAQPPRISTPAPGMTGAMEADEPFVVAKGASIPERSRYVESTIGDMADEPGFPTASLPETNRAMSASSQKEQRQKLFVENDRAMPQRSMASSMESEKRASDIPVTREKPAKRRNPQAWLEEIEKLRLNGKIREARESLTEFRKHYPDHKLPEPLRNLINNP